MNIIIPIFLLFLENINSFIFTLNQFFPKYCFYKIIKTDEVKIIFNYATIGEKEELVNVTFIQTNPNTKEIYSKSYLDSDEYISPNLKKGKYNLCFIPNTKNEFKISFNFQTLEEDENMNRIATDTQLKNIAQKIKQIKNGFNNLENNSNNLMNNKYFHLSYLYKYLKQIKNLTFAKIIVIGSVTLFQIYVIQKMFGEDKRISKIKTGKINNKIDFL